MIFFLICKKWKTFFNIKKNWQEVLMQFAWLLFLIFLAFFTVFLYEAAQQDLINIQLSSIVRGVNYSFLLFPILLKFFPSLAQKKIFIKKNYPLTKARLVLFDLLYSIFSETWIFFMCISATILFIISPFNTFQCVTFIEFGICGILFAENLVNAIYNNKRYYSFLILFLLVSVIFLISVDFFVKSQYIVYLSIFILLIVIYYLLYKPMANEDLMKPQYMLEKSKYLTLKMAVRNKKHRYTSVFAIISQIIILYAFTLLLRNDIQVVIFNLISFSILFSYCYNNLWGYFPSASLNMLIAGSKMESLIFLFIKLLLPAFFITCLMFLLYFYIFPDILSLKNLIGFITLSFFSVALGLIFSFTRVKIITKTLSLRTQNYSASVSAVYILSIVSLVFGFAQKRSVLFYLLIIFLLVTSFVLIIILLKKQDMFIKKLKRRIILDPHIKNTI